MSRKRDEQRVEKGIYVRDGMYLIRKMVKGQKINETVGPVKTTKITDVRTVLAKRVAAIDKGEYDTERNARSLTVKDVVERYWAEYASDPRKLPSGANTIGYYRLPLVRLLGSRRINTLTPEVASDYALERTEETVRDTDKKVSWQSVKTELNALNAAIRWHIKIRELRDNPFEGWRREVNNLIRKNVPPTARGKGPNVLDDGQEDGPQWQVLFAKADPRLRIGLAILYETGMRINELLQMEWSWIDEKRNVIRVPGWADELTDTPHRVTKTGCDREIPMSAKLLMTLRQIPRNHRLVYCRTDGRKWVSLYKGFRAARRRAKLPKWVTFHTLRRTRATIWDRLDAAACRAAIGHQSDRVAYGSYVRVTDDRAQDLVQVA